MNILNTHLLVTENHRRQLPVIWLALIVCQVGIFALACAQDQPTAPEALSLITAIEGPNDVEVDAVRFEAIDVFVDSKAAPLAAYQLEVASVTPGVEIVGIEGGQHPAFAEPPYYDSKAMNNNRVILAAFNTGDNLPSGRTRVARIHVQLQGPGMKEYRTSLTASATASGEEIPASISVAKAQQ